MNSMLQFICTESILDVSCYLFNDYFKQPAIVIMLLL